jgi:hypothetical protein
MAVDGRWREVLDDYGTSDSTHQQTIDTMAVPGMVRIHAQTTRPAHAGRAVVI